MNFKKEVFRFVIVILVTPIFYTFFTNYPFITSLVIVNNCVEF